MSVAIPVFSLSVLMVWTDTTFLFIVSDTFLEEYECCSSLALF